MSTRNPNSGTSGSSSPSPSPGENRGSVVPQREEIQADETVPKEEELEQSAADTADSASKEEEIPKQENPVEEIPKQENPDEKIPAEENPDKKIPEQEEIPVEEMTEEEEDPEEENPTFEPSTRIGRREMDDPEIAETFTFIPEIKRIRLQRPENPPFDLNRGTGIAEPENPNISDIFRQPENSRFDRRIATREPENSFVAEIFASSFPTEPYRGYRITEINDPTIAEILPAMPGNKRIRIHRPEHPTIVASFDSRPNIEPNRGITIREPQNPIQEQQDNDEVDDENPRPAKICRCISKSCFLFPRSTSEEEDDIITTKFVSVYCTNQGPLPSAGSPENFDPLFAFITSQFPQGKSINLENLKDKLAKLLNKYLRISRQRDVSLNFEALATNYARELYRLGTDVWGNANAQGNRSPGGNVGTSGASGDSS